MALGSLPVLALLVASLGSALMDDNLSGASPVQRRYSEATLASDYSRAMDHVLKKNFVEWLLARRERKSENIAEQLKREAEPQKESEDEENSDLGAQGGKDFLAWVWKNAENRSFAAPEGSEALRKFLDQEFVTWLMSSDLCRATTA